MVRWDNVYSNMKEAKAKAESFIEGSLTGKYTTIKLLEYPPRLKVITYFKSSVYLLEFIEVLLEVCGGDLKYEWEYDDGNLRAVFIIKPRNYYHYGF